MSELLSAVEIEPRGKEATASVIWLHGLGADGHDFEPIVPELGLPAGSAVRFIFPHAPVRPVTINGGMSMRAWYDILGIGPGQPQDEVGVRASEAAVHGLIARENSRGVSCERIVLAGFSQGGAIALHTGLRYPTPLAGIMALSTYLPLADLAEAERHQANHDTPIFMAHGRQDQMVPYGYGRASCEQLQAFGHSLEWHDYPMEHAVCLEQIRDIGAWLQRVLGLGPGG
jgi:phospholipase/carboxylesterase